MKPAYFQQFKNVGQQFKNVEQQFNNVGQQLNNLRQLLLVVCCTVSLTSATSFAQDAQDAVQKSNEYSAHTQDLRLQIALLQSSSGPYNAELLEPLQTLSDTLIETGDWVEASSLLEQQLQIYRIGDGLYSNTQIPVIEKLMNLDVLRNDWEAASNRLSFLSWLHLRDSQSPAAEQLAGLRRVRDWHLFILNNDNPQREAEHLLSIRDLSQRAMAMATQQYGANSEALVDFMHDQAQAELYIALAIVLTPDNSSELISDIEGVSNSAGPRLTQLRTVSDIEAAYGSKVNTVIDRTFRSAMGKHFRKLSEIRDYYAGIQNSEAEAMALILMGDSMLMREQYKSRPLEFAGQRRGSGNIGLANRYYTEAAELLVSEGFDTADIAHYFSCPSILPINQFTPSFSTSNSGCQKESDQSLYDLGDVHLLVDSVPSPQQDEIGQQQNYAPEQSIVTLNFSVNGNGQANRIEVVAAEPDETQHRTRARNIVERLQFRPAIVNGRPVRTENITMRLVLPE